MKKEITRRDFGFGLAALVASACLADTAPHRPEVNDYDSDGGILEDAGGNQDLDEDTLPAGDSDATVEKSCVTIEWFLDYANPFGPQASETHHQILESYGHDVQFLYRHLPIHGENSIMAAVAAECAREQGAFLAYHDLLFANQKEWINSDEFSRFFLAYARELGLDLDSFDDCLSDPESRAAVMDDRNTWYKQGIRYIPTFLINDREPIVGAVSYTVLAGIIDEELKECEE